MGLGLGSAQVRVRGQKGRPSTPTPTDPLRQLTAADRVERPAPAGALGAGTLVAGDFVVGVASALVAGDRVSVPLRVATISVFSVITQTYAVTATSPHQHHHTRHLSYLILSLSGCRVRCMCVTVFAFGFRRLQTRGNPEAQEDAPAAPPAARPTYVEALAWCTGR